MSRGRELQPGEAAIAMWQYPQAITALNRLLKPHGVRLAHRTCYSQFGDLVAVKTEKTAVKVVNEPRQPKETT